MKAIKMTPSDLGMDDVFEGLIEANKPVGKELRQLTHDLRFKKSVDGEWIKQKIEDENPETIEWVFEVAEKFVTKIKLTCNDIVLTSIEDLTYYTEGNELIQKIVMKLLEMPKLGKRSKAT